jgi:hypothetical protein
MFNVSVKSMTSLATAMMLFVQSALCPPVICGCQTDSASVSERSCCHSLAGKQAADRSAHDGASENVERISAGVCCQHGQCGCGKSLPTEQAGCGCSAAQSRPQPDSQQVDSVQKLPRSSVASAVDCELRDSRTERYAVNAARQSVRATTRPAQVLFCIWQT